MKTVVIVNFFPQPFLFQVEAHGDLVHLQYRDLNPSSHKILLYYRRKHLSFSNETGQDLEKSGILQIQPPI